MGQVGYLHLRQVAAGGSFIMPGAYTLGNTYLAYSPPSLNDSGSVAYRAIVAANGATEIVRNGTTLYDSSGMFDGFYNVVPVINNSGRVAFLANTDTAGEWGLFTGDGGATTTIVSSLGGIAPATTEGAISMNNSGVVAFVGGPPAVGSNRLYLGSGGALSTVASTAGGQYTGFYSAAINDLGDVAFRAATSVGTGIYTGPNATNDKIVATNDVLFGNTVVELDLYREGLNDAGTVVFYARLLTPQSQSLYAIVRATPLPLGDVNMDCVVNIFDVNLVSAHWGESGPTADANRDGVVNIFDVNLISAHWAETCAGAGVATSVPEPPSIALAIVAAISLVLLRLRFAPSAQACQAPHAINTPLRRGP